MSISSSAYMIFPLKMGPVVASKVPLKPKGIVIVGGGGVGLTKVTSWTKSPSVSWVGTAAPIRSPTAHRPFKFVTWADAAEAETKNKRIAMNAAFRMRRMRCVCILAKMPDIEYRVKHETLFGVAKVWN